MHFLSLWLYCEEEIKAPLLIGHKKMRLKQKKGQKRSLNNRIKGKRIHSFHFPLKQL